MNTPIASFPYDHLSLMVEFINYDEASQLPADEL